MAPFLGSNPRGARYRRSEGCARPSRDRPGRRHLWRGYRLFHRRGGNRPQDAGRLHRRLVIERGSIYWADVGAPIGSRPAKRRPVLVISATA